MRPTNPIIDVAEKYGIQFAASPEPGKLAIHAPAGICTPKVLEIIRRGKASILETLAESDESDPDGPAEVEAARAAEYRTNGDIA